MLIDGEAQPEQTGFDKQLRSGVPQQALLGPGLAVDQVVEATNTELLDAVDHGGEP